MIWEDGDIRKALADLKRQGIQREDDLTARVANPGDTGAFVHAVELINACNETRMDLARCQDTGIFKVDEEVLADEVKLADEVDEGLR